MNYKIIKLGAGPTADKPQPWEPNGDFPESPPAKERPDTTEQLREREEGAKKHVEGGGDIVEAWFRWNWPPSGEDTKLLTAHNLAGRAAHAGELTADTHGRGDWSYHVAFNEYDGFEELEKLRSEQGGTWLIEPEGINYEEEGHQPTGQNDAIVAAIKLEISIRKHHKAILTPEEPLVGPPGTRRRGYASSWEEYVGLATSEEDKEGREWLMNNWPTFAATNDGYENTYESFKRWYLVKQQEAGGRAITVQMAIEMIQASTGASVWESEGGATPASAPPASAPSESTIPSVDPSVTPKQPVGGKTGEIINDLVKLASHLDDNGYVKEADRLDEIIANSIKAFRLDMGKDTS